MTEFSRYKLFLWYFGRYKVPMIGYLKPRLIELTEEKITVKLGLKRRSKNHLDSMYFGALSVGADLAGGLHGFYHSKKAGVKSSIAFKSFHADFLKRPEQDVYFVCEEGLTVKKMISESKSSKKRINETIKIKAYINYPEKPEEVAVFDLLLSIKALN